MKSFDVDWLKGTCREIGLTLRCDDLVCLNLGDEMGPGLVISTEHREAADLILLANHLLWPSLDDSDSTPIGGGAPYVLWIRESGIWNDVQEAMAAEAFTALLNAYGQRPVVKGLMFEDADRAAATLFVLHVLLFSWDAYVLPLSGRFALHLSHDGYVSVHSRDGGIRSWLQSRLGAWGD